ncbi:MAG: hypothetical protein NZ518_05780 [Dehalococcoidia bacterium]|nr:hypothetical protein [Dehalococcoidia bacterium]
MAGDPLWREIETFLGRSARESAENVLMEGGILLALLARRRLTVATPSFLVRPGDRDARRLLRYLVAPGLAPDLATVERDGESIRIAPNWPRLASYFGKSLPEFADLLERRFRPVLERNWPTINYLLSHDTVEGAQREPDR